ncbi:MAG TPA: hypothetical protein VIN08_25465 [Ohtaekwangia sp.]|uniref:hypothetical protein n=1 Tax=Ohtaekwangia sp. TaxID=2066019 RepID=UPI002F95124F
MRTRNFEVPADLITEFAQIMEDHELDNVIEGVTEDGEIEISVDYEPAQKKVIEQIHEIIDRYHDENEENDLEEEGETEDEDEDEN